MLAKALLVFGSVAGRQRLVHGPMDVLHFSRIGYTLLGAEAARSLRG